MRRGPVPALDSPMPQFGLRTLFASICAHRSFLSSLWLLLLCTVGFGTNALGKLPSGAEQSARQGEFWTRITDANVIYVGETHDSRRDHEYELGLVRSMRPSKNIRVTRGKVALHVASRSNRILFDRQPLIHVEPKSPVGCHVSVDERRQCT